MIVSLRCHNSVMPWAQDSAGLFQHRPSHIGMRLYTLFRSTCFVSAAAWYYPTVARPPRYVSCSDVAL